MDSVDSDVQFCDSDRVDRRRAISRCGTALLVPGEEFWYELGDDGRHFLHCLADSCEWIRWVVPDVE